MVKGVVGVGVGVSHGSIWFLRLSGLIWTPENLGYFFAMNTFQKCGKKCIQQSAFNEIQMMMGMQKNVEYKRRGAVHTREKTGPLSDLPIWVTICGVVADHRGGKQSL